MKPRTLISVIAIAVMTALSFTTSLAAQDAAPAKPAQHHQYKLIDLGTFGGPQSAYFSEPVVQSVNNRGTVAGGADTALPDPYAPNCFYDCYIMHAFQWANGVLTDLGTLPGGYSSAAYWINDRGDVMGGSENGLIDHLTGLPEQISVVWKHGQIQNLGTLGGSFSFGNAMNNRGDVVGLALNAVSDPLSYLGLGTQTRAFLWRKGTMQDLGTLGGPDSWAASINDRGQVAGWALVDSTVNPITGSPTQHPFLWENGVMSDLGTLGGTYAVVGSSQSPGAGASINSSGQVIGASNLAGDLTHHPFLWTRATGMVDLGTLGGDNGEAWWINDAGEIVGRADIAGPQHNHHAFLWKDGEMKDLGVAKGWPCSTAIDINSKGQVIIDTGICGVGGGPGLLWENSALYDLNTLISPGSGFLIGDVNFINDGGEIAATGLLANGDQHALLLIPCDDDHPNVDGCDYSMVDASATSVPRPPALSQPSVSSPAPTLNQLRNRLMQRYRLPGQRPALRD
jgi:probable HAF family extracellular repeat protein